MVVNTPAFQQFYPLLQRASAYEAWGKLDQVKKDREKANSLDRN